MENFRLNNDQLYWHVDTDTLPFNTTKDIKPSIQVYGHETAKEALEFVIKCPAPKLNAYVRGAPSTGRKTVIRHLFNETKPQIRKRRDYCYVHNFSQVNSPRLIILEAGYGKLLKQMMASFADYMTSDFLKSFNDDQIRENRRQTEQKANKEVNAIYAPFEEKLRSQGLVLANINTENGTQTVIAPLHKGRVLNQDEFNQLVASGEISEEAIQTIEKVLPEFQEELIEVAAKADDVIEQSFMELRKNDNDFARRLLSEYLNTISKKFCNTFLDDYLAEIIDDFVETKLHSKKETIDPHQLYGINIVSSPHQSEAAPIIFETAPTIGNLIGTIEMDNNLLPYEKIRAGSIAQADGGFLIIDADDILSESMSWYAIMRTLKTKFINFIVGDEQPTSNSSGIKPDPIPVDVRVILIGSYQRYQQLYFYDNDFASEFKVLVELDSDLPREATSYMQYAQVIAKIVAEENLLHFTRDAIAQLIEHGARLVSGRQKIASSFGKIIDTAREANYLALKEKAELVDRKQVIDAIIAVKRRAFLPVQNFYTLLEKGTIKIDTTGAVVGQINGLAVSQTSNISYGFPARITSTVSPGEAGLINIEGKANLSGQIHTKGFQILGGLLRHLIKPQHPLTFNASIAFEQSYGGIDGDSASGAEACCLLSAIANVPIQQSIAMTGAIDQFGNIQAIGGVNEKIEGFFDCCQFNNLTGQQGVIIPLANVSELMLKPPVLTACKEGRFHIYAVDHVLDALAILTQTESSKSMLLTNTSYPDNSLMDKVCQATQQLYKFSS